jgi:membrane protease YdiL (CAAX protease family)
MNISDLFLGSDGKLRSGWRFACFFTGFVFIARFLWEVAVIMLPSLRETAVELGPATLVVNALIMLVPALFVGWLCGKYLEILPFKALGISAYGRWIRHLILGLTIGAITLLLALGLAMVLTGTTFEFSTSATEDIFRSLAISAGVFALAATAEEVLFRGYILQTFARSGLAWFAIILTAIFFVVVHLGNPEAGLLSSLNTALAGIWFGVAYLKTRDLWFVTGVHFIWNWLQGSVFGIEVSGLTAIAPHPVMREIETGPAWISGGPYGLEGGVVATIAILISTIAIYFLPILRPDSELLALTSPQPTSANPSVS